MLTLDRAEARRGDVVIVRGVSLRAPDPGLLFLVGPGAAGKSSLLAALASRDGVALAGHAVLGERPLGLSSTTDVVWLPQHLQLSGDEPTAMLLFRDHGVVPARTERWLTDGGVADAAALLGQPAGSLPLPLRRFLATMALLRRSGTLFLVDEPTADLDDALAEAVRRELAALAEQATVVVATHNRLDCLALGGHTVLLAGGEMQEFAPTRRFFSSPRTAAGQLYVETGNCGLPVGARQAAPGEEDGIWWLVPGLLAGMSRPGVTAPADVQLDTLADAGVTLLVNAEEKVTYDRATPGAHGLQLLHLPMPDMAPPTFSQTVDLCRMAEPAIKDNHGVAVHCRGGLGRTGTLLAAILIWFGDTADAAITKVRGVRPLAIQSQAQAQFLHDFAERVGEW